MIENNVEPNNEEANDGVLFHGQDRIEDEVTYEEHTLQDDKDEEQHYDEEKETSSFYSVDSDVDMEAVRTRFCIAADMTCAHLGQPAVSVGALLCDDQRMRQLNSQFRGKDSTSNVLSFPDEMPEDETPESPDVTPRLIGELALAHGRLVAEAEDDGVSGASASATARASISDSALAVYAIVSVPCAITKPS